MITDINIKKYTKIIANPPLSIDIICLLFKIVSYFEEINKRIIEL